MQLYNKIFLIYVTLLLLCPHFSAEHNSEEASKLLLQKTTTLPLSQGKESLVVYNIINIGDSSAFTIEVTDTYDTSRFDIPSDPDGDIIFSFDEISPGKTESKNVTIVPKSSGDYVFTRARITYSDGSGSGDDLDVDPETGDLIGKKRTGHSTSIGRVKILSLLESQRLNLFTMIGLSVLVLCIVLLVTSVYCIYFCWYKQRRPRDLESKKSQ